MGSGHNIMLLKVLFKGISHLLIFLSVVSGMGSGHNIMLLKVLFKGISHLLLNFRLLISGHSLSVLHQSVLVIRHVNSIKGVAKNSRLDPAKLQQGFSIVEVGFSTFSGHLALVLGHDLTRR